MTTRQQGVCGTPWEAPRTVSLSLAHHHTVGSHECAGLQFPATCLPLNFGIYLNANTTAIMDRSSKGAASGSSELRKFSGDRSQTGGAKKSPRQLGHHANARGGSGGRLRADHGNSKTTKIRPFDLQTQVVRSPIHPPFPPRTAEAHSSACGSACGSAPALGGKKHLFYMLCRHGPIDGTSELAVDSERARGTPKDQGQVTGP